MNTLPFISHGKTGSMHFKKDSDSSKLMFLFIYSLLTATVLLVIIGRLFQLTIVQGNYYTEIATQNRVREIVIEAPRGTIIDRKGEVITFSKEIPAASDQDRSVTRRIYNAKESIAHVLGYVQKADENDIASSPCLEKLKLNDKVGKKGIEKIYECELKGKKGKKLIEMDAQGKFNKLLHIQEPVAGDDIQLSIDMGLQETAWEALQRDQKGAVVVVKPKTGEIMALVSNPSYDPEAFEQEDTDRTSEYLTSDDKPMFNRATEGTYPPGSTFKMFVASAGLEEHVVDKGWTVEDKGFVEAGPQRFHNWYYLEQGRTDGLVDVVKALQRSNDIYFYVVGGKLGGEKIKKWANLFGFQNRTNTGLEESEGTIPSSFWKEDVLGEPWYLGDTYNLSIGQGYVESTPLQVTMATAVFANGGSLCSPMLLKKDTLHAPKVNCKKIPLSEETYSIIREGMKKACQPEGTGWPLFNFGIPIATNEAELLDKDNVIVASGSGKIEYRKKMEIGCKTGTAESHAESGKPHAWFTAFAPFDDPEILVTVLVEEGGQGSDTAAPIAKTLLEQYFKQ